MENKRNQFYVSTKSRLNGYNLDFSYKNQNYNNQNYIVQKLGADLKKTTDIIPGGIIIAFPNYKLLENCYEL